MRVSHGNIREIHNIGQDTHEWIVSGDLCPPLVTAGISLTGITEADATFYFFRSRPSMAQVLVCVGGSGHVLVEGEWQTCDAGSAYITPPGPMHAYEAKGGEAWRIGWLIYDELRSAEIGVTVPTLLRADVQPLWDSIRNLHTEVMGTAASDLMGHWVSLADAYAQRIIGPQTRLAAVWRVVATDISHNWTLSDLAGHAAMSEETLRRISLSEVGVSPLRYITRMRMREAASLLNSHSYTVEQVADRVGYDNAFALSTAFKRVMGMSPSAYRATQTRLQDRDD